LIDDILEILRSVSEQVILPRFKALQQHEIEEKSPGEVADRDCFVASAPRNDKSLDRESRMATQSKTDSLCRKLRWGLSEQR
jgi:hypothetical protein